MTVSSPCLRQILQTSTDFKQRSICIDNTAGQLLMCGIKKCVYTQGECVCECVIASKARSRRARQLMGGVNGPNSRVHICQTLKQVVVQRCGLTSDRKAAPRPPAPAHPRQSQYMWTLKMHAPGIHLQERGRTCAAQDARSFELLCAFVAALPPRAAPQNHT